MADKGAEKAKNQAMAADLARRGYPRGVRMTSPAPNSGGLANLRNVTGSTKYQRRQKSLKG